MPDRIPVFKPPWIAKRPRKRDAKRDQSWAGYGLRAWKLARRQALVRDGYQCQCCGIVVHGKEAHVHHNVPKRDGGTDYLDNLETRCRSCHSKETVREMGGRIA